MKKLISFFITRLSTIYKITAMMVTTAIILLIFPQQQSGTGYDYSEGGFWRQDDLYAPCDFAVLKTQGEIDREVGEAKGKMLLYFGYDSSARSSALYKMSTIHADPSLRHAMPGIINDIYRRGYTVLPAEITDASQHTLVLLQGNVGSEHHADEFYTPQNLDRVVSRHLHDEQLAAQAASLLADSVLVPSIRYDEVRTQLELDSRLSQITYTSSLVQKGELVVAKGEYISAEKALKIQSLENELSDLSQAEFNPALHYLGLFVLCAIAFVALYMFLKNTRHRILNDGRSVTFVFVIVLLTAALTSTVLRINPDWVLAVPICIVPILMRIFYDMRAALYIHIVTIVILGNLVPNPFEFIFYQLIAGMMCIITVKNFEQRSKFFVVALVLFCTYSLIYTAGILSQDTTFSTIRPERYAIFFANAVLTLLALPLIYIFERIFGITTNLTLLEISSTNTPALRELSRTAPGTFQHSMQVANICEDLLGEIGGNALLARVGALYHDIGKINAPLYFTENQNTDYNPHADLTNQESAHVITQHVRDGVELARRYHLPACVTDFIRTHHGTTYTGYFYAKQRQESGGLDFDTEAFRYPGPRPFSRETAVVMLVDSVEAACKSLPEPTAEAIRQLVDRIIDGKIAEEQLSNCDITFADITRIRQLLKHKMPSIYHLRVTYPLVDGN
ncbi:MAG: HDIG domain-containing protein [Bacteroidales bacterium]|nr:HDIG domain-containing protein [Bacteroidales bacterium]